MRNVSLVVLSLLAVAPLTVGTARADSITLDSGAVLQGDLARFEFGGDCQISVTEGDLAGVIVIVPCHRVESFVRTGPRLPVPVATVTPDSAAAPSVAPVAEAAVLPAPVPVESSRAAVAGALALDLPGEPAPNTRVRAPLPAEPPAAEPAPAALPVVGVDVVPAPLPVAAAPVVEATPLPAAPAAVPEAVPEAVADAPLVVSDQLASDAPSAAAPTVLEQLLGAQVFDEEPAPAAPVPAGVSIVAQGPQPTAAVSARSTVPSAQPRPAPSMGDVDAGADASFADEAAPGERAPEAPPTRSLSF